MIKNISRRVRKLKGRAQPIESTLPVLFSQVCAELDDIWREIGDIKLVLLVGGYPLLAALSFFQGRQRYRELAPPVGMSPPALQVLMRQVVDELRALGFVTCDMIEATVAPTFDPNTHDRLSGLSKHIASIKRHFTDPDGTVSKMEGRIRSPKDRRARDSIA
jgi:hypothetical protein